MTTDKSAMMTDDELAELDQFLLSAACDEEALAIDEAHGCLTALLLTPVAVEKEAWQRLIWGEPRFANGAEQAHMSSLMERLYSDIANTLSRRREFEPLVIEAEEDGEVVESYEGWCFGFMIGVEQLQAQWDALPKNEQGLLAPMAQLALLGSDEEEPMSEEEYLQWVELIPGAVMGLYTFWHPH